MKFSSSTTTTTAKIKKTGMLRFFDAGCSTWNARDLGGSSLTYFTAAALRQGALFDAIDGYDVARLQLRNWISSLPEPIARHAGADGKRVRYHPGGIAMVEKVQYSDYASHMENDHNPFLAQHI